MVARSKRSEFKRRVFELQKLSAQRCLEPSGGCFLAPIRAHSIQNANILDRLCSDGHVIMPKLKEQSAGKIGVCFDSIGRNQATTFTGLCSKHDQAIFDPIDKGPIDAPTDEHLFLFAYRSVLRELHAALGGAIKIQLGFQEKVELGLVRGDVPTRDGVRAVEHLMNAYESYLYKREYDAAYSAKDFGRIEHVRLFEQGRLPTLAVSALFSLDSIVVGNDVARVALNVYPSGDGVMVVFSFLRNHAQYICPFLEPFQASSGDQLLKMVSVRVLNSCENFVIAPRFWNGLDNSKKMAIRDFYVSSLLTDVSDLENYDFTLFSPE
jgi:hypothetical protein